MLFPIAQCFSLFRDFVVFSVCSWPTRSQKKEPIIMRNSGGRTNSHLCHDRIASAYPLSQNDYRQEKIIFELFSGALRENPVRAPGAIT